MPLTSLEDARDVIARLQQRLRAGVVGRDDVIDLVIVALLSDGHVLLEDFPGSGKTTLAKTLGGCLIDDLPEDRLAVLRRIQFTPDLLPGDVTGTTIFDPKEHRFFFRPGPLFAHIVLADEINRTSPKVQSALLESMAEKQITVDNETYPLDDLFLVIATQNPLDLAGTFPLPAAQLDRFLFKIRMTHISPAAELDLLKRLDSIKAGPSESLKKVTRTEILEARQIIHDAVHVSDAIKEALVRFAEASRDHAGISLGVSTRSLVLILPALQAQAALSGRDYVRSEDIEALAVAAFAHRLALAPGSQHPEELVKRCLKGPLEGLARMVVSR